MTDIISQIITALATLAAVGLTLFSTARSERQRVRDADIYRNHRERQEAAVTFLAGYDAFYFASLNYQAGNIHELPAEIRPSQEIAGARIELFLPQEVRDAARAGMRCLNQLWDAVQDERSGEESPENSSVADLLTQASEIRTIFLRSARGAVGER